MRELWDIVSLTAKGFYCRLFGHRWLDLRPDRGSEFICLRCFLHEYGVADD